MPDEVLIPNAAAVGIRIQSRNDRIGGTTSAYYCIGGPLYDRRGRWVSVTTSDNDATKLAALQSALS